MDSIQKCVKTEPVQDHLLRDNTNVRESIYKSSRRTSKRSFSSISLLRWLNNVVGGEICIMKICWLTSCILQYLIKWISLQTQLCIIRVLQAGKWNFERGQKRSKTTFLGLKMINFGNFSKFLASFNLIF